MIDVGDQRWTACTVTHGFNETRARVAPGSDKTAWRFYLPSVQAAHIPVLTDAEREWCGDWTPVLFNGTVGYLRKASIRPHEPGRLLVDVRLVEKRRQVWLTKIA